MATVTQVGGHVESQGKGLDTVVTRKKIVPFACVFRCFLHLVPLVGARGRQ